VQNAKVWVLNGPDTLMKLLKLRAQLGTVTTDGPEFFILGRVRMRMGFHWRPAFARLRKRKGEIIGVCPHCGEIITDMDGNPIPVAALEAEENRRKCPSCGNALWTLMRPRGLSASEQSSVILKSLKRIPTIGEATAQKLIRKFGESFLASMLADNIHEFINLMDDNGEPVFSDRRIGQKQPVRVIYLGYAGTTQMDCLELMAKKIAVSQSTSGEVPDSGLDVLNQGGDSIEVALARQLVEA
jgi:predicted RNA-binding Zn-ribbon protein involved in translation (DUF1610 family)